MHAVTASVATGFQDPVHEAQSVFQATLDAMSRPGRIIDVATQLTAPAPLSAVAGAVALTLVDNDTPVWLDTVLRTAAVEDYLQFHTGCPITADPGEATFGLIADLAHMPDFDDFAFGETEHPDRSVTLILQVDAMFDAMAARRVVRFSGSGIEREHAIAVDPLDDEFWRTVQRNNARLPLGLDFIFTSDDAVVACPHGTSVKL